MIDNDLKKLYIGNLPIGLTPPILLQFLNSALMKLKPNLFYNGSPIVTCWISSDGHYAFIEFRSIEEANAGFILNGYKILDKPLKIGRPKSYIGLTENNDVLNTAAYAFLNKDKNKLNKGKKIVFPTNVLNFVGMVKEIDIENEDVYNEIKNDVKLECEEFGKVEEIFMPRKDIDENDVPGIGNVYVKFDNVDSAKNARKNLISRRFDGRLLTIKYYEEDKFNKKIFEDNEEGEKNVNKNDGNNNNENNNEINENNNNNNMGKEKE